MSYLYIELARTIDEDRYREAEHCRRINEVLATREKRSTHLVQMLVRWLRSLTRQGQQIAPLGQPPRLPEIPKLSTGR